MPHQIFAVHGPSTQPLEYSRAACGIPGTHPRAPVVESSQEDLCVVHFFCRLVLIQHDHLLRAAAGAVQPHIGLAGGGTSRFLQHLQGRFIGVQHRLLTQRIILEQHIVCVLFFQSILPPGVSRRAVAG